MFEQTFVDGVGKTNKSWTVVLSFAVQFVVDRRLDPDSADLHGCAAEGAVDQFAGRRRRRRRRLRRLRLPPQS